MRRTVAIAGLIVLCIVGFNWARIAESADEADTSMVRAGGCTMQSAAGMTAIPEGQPVTLIEPDRAAPVRYGVSAWIVSAPGIVGSVYTDCLELATIDQLTVRVAELEAAVSALESSSPPTSAAAPSGMVHLQCGSSSAFTGIGDIQLVTGTDFIDGPRNEGSLNPSMPQSVEVVTGAMLTAIDATCTISQP